MSIELIQRVIRVYIYTICKLLKRATVRSILCVSCAPHAETQLEDVSSTQ